MSLEFSDFARFYESSGLTDAEQREDFEIYACFMECLVSYFWRNELPANPLGIKIDSDTIALISGVQSDHQFQKTFNDAAHINVARKTAL